MNEDPNQHQPPEAAPPVAPPADNSAVMSVLAYIGILVVIPFIVAKDNPIVKFHIKQGLVLLVIEIAVWVVGTFLWMTWVIWPLLSLVNLATLILSIIGIINVIQHKQKELPIVGAFASRFTF